MLRTGAPAPRGWPAARHASRNAARRLLRLLETRTQDLIGDDLHRHRDVQRRIGRIGRNAQQRMRVAQLLVGQAGAFGAEHDRHRRALQPRSTARRAAARASSHAKVLIALAAGGRQHQPAALQRGGQIGLDARALPAGPRRRRRARWPPDAETAAAAPAPAHRAPYSSCARATAPMLPGCEVSTRTMRIESGTTCYPNRLSAISAMHPLLNIAVRAARRAGEIIVRSLVRLESLRGHLQGPQRLRQRDRPHAPNARSSTSSTSTIPTTRSWPRRAAAAARTTRSGSSIRSTAPPTSCTVFRCSRYRSRSSSAANSRSGSSTIRCARRSSPPRAAVARIWRTIASASASSAGSRARCWRPAFPIAKTSPYADNYFAMFRMLTTHDAPAFAGRARRRWIWLMSRPDASMASGRWV